MMAGMETLGRRLRLGMVGGGRDAFIGGVHRIAARIDDRYELVAGALSSSPEKAKASGADLLLAEDRAYGSYEEMAAAEAGRDDGIDAVAIVTPNHAHFGPAKAFLDAGIHVICDKPLTTTLEDAEALQAAVASSGLVFGLTHNYTGYPLVRHAREMVAAGELGRIRVIQAEYPQDWLSTRLEDDGVKQAEWRTDPSRSGPAGSVGDIGNHAYNLARFITGLELDEIAADLHTFVDGRALDDNAHMMLRFAGGAKGMLWSSQVAPGNENALRIRIYGEKGGLTWDQENPNLLTHSPLGEAPRILRRGGPGLGAAAEHASRIPPGHPEGYLEGFATLYSDLADQISARIVGGDADPLAMTVPTVADGVDGVRFITRAVESSRAGGGWLRF
ncbi:MAG: Gfo/Idh/MocA family oxidoreductase [Alphaproteobacteria bacterium]|jgi:predicted dehydrogenase|nr:Gfo/Idh/MocA family oxidoreductase [Alphaproteobacteria bacterium]